ncbi:hypothetical protein PIB30_031884 [Stylosanthes scabra]|uniref:Uncharacterized protein n=1 Tax=Stylosanthes scabra TaxID=79078 RepID=A0ABU6WE59_9FABA|nr:hypothetical protein [Stylosanthes scabra]
MRYRGGVVIGGSQTQSQPQRRKKRKNKAVNLLHAHPESVTVDSVNGSNHDFEVNKSQLLADVTTDAMPTTSATEQNSFSYGELRYRSLNGGATCAVSVLDDGNSKELSSVTSAEVGNSQKEVVVSGGGNVARSDTLESVELNRVLLCHDSDSDKSPVTYFLEELYNGNSLRGTTTLGDEKGRERVYDTIFRLPWRCELVLAYRCWLLCLLQFFSVIVNRDADKDCNHHLEKSKSKEVQEAIYS